MARWVVACLVVLCGCSAGGSNVGAGKGGIPSGACSVPDRGAGTYVENGWYYCPGQQGGVTPEIEICNNGHLDSAGGCTCAAMGNASDCFADFDNNGNYDGKIACDYAGQDCSICLPGSGCQ